MPTRNIRLTAEQDAFIEEVVRSGRYEDASEAMRDALRRLQDSLEEQDIKREILRNHLQAGLDCLARGEFVDLDDDELESLLDTLGKADA